MTPLGYNTNLGEESTRDIGKRKHVTDLYAMSLDHLLDVLIILTGALAMDAKSLLSFGRTNLLEKNYVKGFSIFSGS